MLRIALVVYGPTELLVVFGTKLVSGADLAHLLIAQESLLFAVRIATVVGALELARIVPSRRSLGAKLVVAGWVIAFALTCLYLVFAIKPAWLPSWGHKSIAWAWYSAEVAVGIGFAWIVWKKPAVALSGLVVWMIAEPPPPLSSLLRSHPTLEYVQLALFVIGTLLLLVLAMVAVSDVPSGFVIPEPRRAKLGFTMIAHSLWWRLMAAVLVPVLTVMLATSHAAASMLTAIQIASLINGVTFAWFSFAAFTVARSNAHGVNRWLFVAAGFGSGLCASVTMMKLCSYGGTIGDEYAHAYELGLPIVAALTLVVLAIGIARFAAATGARELAARATSLVRLLAFLEAVSVLLSVAALHNSASGIAAIALLLVIAAVVVIARTASVAGAAAESIAEDLQPDLPAAKLI